MLVLNLSNRLGEGGGVFGHLRINIMEVNIELICNSLCYFFLFFVIFKKPCKRKCMRLTGNPNNFLEGAVFVIFFILYFFFLHKSPFN